MKAYQTVNGYYYQEIECQPSPLEPGVYLVPAGAVKERPPTVGKNQIQYWNGSEWITRPDFSEGIFYRKSDGSKYQYAIGEELSVDDTDKKPIENEQFQRFVNGDWHVDEESKKLEEIKVSNRKIMNDLIMIDLRSIRAIRENNVTRIMELENEAIVLRNKIIK